VRDIINVASSPFAKFADTNRFGTPIVVVSGLPRSGTSMAMGMLQAGGLALMVDGVREADESNPRGYYECERVKDLDKDPDTSWLEGARGKAIKIISFLLPYLPESNNYRVIFMHRRMEEIVASQNRMLSVSGESSGSLSDDVVALRYQDHLNQAKRLLAERRCFDVLDVQYGAVLDRPFEQAGRINQFVGGKLEVSSMAGVVDRALHRQRT